MFPKAKHDDLVDSMMQAITYSRNAGLAQTDEETRAEENERVTHRPRRKVLHGYAVVCYLLCGSSDIGEIRYQEGIAHLNPAGSPKDLGYLLWETPS
jgi:hypothetical protein